MAKFDEIKKANDEQKRLKLRRDLDSTTVQKPDSSVDYELGSAYPEAQVFVHDLNQFVTVQLL